MTDMTKDESYLIKLFKMATGLGDPFHEIDRYEIGKALGHGDKSVDGIVRMLAQTNFVRKGEGNAICLTTNGHKLVKELLSI